MCTGHSGAHAAAPGSAWFLARVWSFLFVAFSLAVLPFPPCVALTVTMSLLTRSAVSSFSDGLQQIPLYGRTASQCRWGSLSVSSFSGYRISLQKSHVPGLMECFALASSWPRGSRWARGRTPGIGGRPSARGSRWARGRTPGIGGRPSARGSRWARAI